MEFLQTFFNIVTGKELWEKRRDRRRIEEIIQIEKVKAIKRENSIKRQKAASFRMEDLYTEPSQKDLKNISSKKT